MRVIVILNLKVLERAKWDHAYGTFSTVPSKEYMNCHYYRQTSFYYASLHCTLQILCFLQIEGLWQPCIEQVYRCHFSNSICSLCISVSHFGNSCNISNFFIIIIFLIVICYQWSLMLYYDSLKAQMMVSIFYKAGLMVLNSLSFCLSVKLLISPSDLNEILAG